MASLLRIPLTIVPAVLLSAALPALSPAAAASEAEGHAVAQCRAELLRQFPDGALRSHRVGTIAGNSRATRVTLHATADRRYRFECAADAQGRIVTATLTPPGATRLAAEQRNAVQQPQ